MGIKLTFLGHSGFLVSDGSHTVAIDPFLSGNPVASHQADDIACDAICLTHGHADHFGDTLDIAKRNNATIYATYEIAEYCGAQGVNNCEPMNPGGRVDAPFGWVALTQAFHSSSYNGTYMGMPCGVVLHIGGVTIWHCGDTGLFSDMKLLGEIYQPDIAMIPIGDRFTMGPALATRAAEMIKPKIAIPVHFNTWPPIEQNPADFKPTGVTVKVLQPGDTLQHG